MKERWFNYRPICLTFAFLLLGSLFACFFSKQLALTIVISIIVAVLLLILAIYKKKFRYFIIPLTSFVLGVISFNISVYSFNSNITEMPNEISARICSTGKPNDNYIRMQADSCTFDGESAGNNIYIIIYDSTGLYAGVEIGSQIKFKPSGFYKNELFTNDTPDAKLFSENIKYTAIVNFENIEIIGLDKTLAETVKENVKENLKLGLSNENVEIAYSCLFGDKELLSENQYSAYKLSGIAHLLAVSGLHVGIIVLVISKLLEIFKIKRWGKLCIIGVFLFFYTYICNFSISVIRASIMAIILMLSRILKQEYDTYNSISIAGIIIFIINPLCLFDISFVMSFSCAIGIAMLYKPILKASIKLKINDSIAKAFALSASTMVSLIIIMAFYFKTLNVISILANVILIPIFTLAFIPTFIVSMLSLIIPTTTYLLYPVNYVFAFINLVATVLGNLSISNFATIEINFVAIIVYFALLVILGRLCSSKWQYKLAISVPIVALLVCCLI